MISIHSLVWACPGKSTVSSCPPLAPLRPSYTQRRGVGRCGGRDCGKGGEVAAIGVSLGSLYYTPSLLGFTLCDAVLPPYEAPIADHTNHLPVSFLQTFWIPRSPLHLPAARIMIASRLLTSPFLLLLLLLGVFSTTAAQTADKDAISPQDVALPLDEVSYLTCSSTIRAFIC